MDTKTLIHVGTEVVVAAGMAIWMKKLGDRITRLESMISLQEKELTEHAHVIRAQSAIIDDLMGIPRRRAPPPKTPQPPASQPARVEVESRAPPAPSNSTPPSPSVQKEEVEPTLTEEQLDKILEAELK